MLTRINDLQWLLEQQAAMIADLQNQQATVAAQNPAPTLALISALASASRLSKVHIVKPPDFNSNNYNTFKQAIKLYLLAAHQDFAIEQDQILSILSHMKGKHIGTWV